MAKKREPKEQKHHAPIIKKKMHAEEEGDTAGVWKIGLRRFHDGDDDLFSRDVARQLRLQGKDYPAGQLFQSGEVERPHASR